MTAMRILLIGPVPLELGGRDTGGIPTHNAGLAAHLSARGHAVSVLADNRPFDAAAWPHRVGELDVYGVADFAGPRRAAGLRSPAVWGATLAARRSLAGVGSVRWIAAATAAYDAVVLAASPDIIHVHALEGRFAFATAVNRRRVPVVATAHSTHYFEFAPSERREAHRRLVARNLSAAHDVIFVSRYLERRYEEIFPAAVGAIDAHVIPNPVDLGRFPAVDRLRARESLGISPSERVLLFVGNLIPRKDPASLVRAVGLLTRSGREVTVLLVGSGLEERPLRELVAAERIERHVRFEGAKSQAQIGPYYAAADLLVFPSLMESFGLVAVEAMLYGTPVVGTPEVLAEVVPGGCGIRTEPGDPASLAAAVAEALDRTWDRELIVSYARGFDWRARVGQYEALYERVLTTRPLRRG